MSYFITFLEGINLIYIALPASSAACFSILFCGQNTQDNKRKTFVNAVGFVAGFTVVYITMGVFAGFIEKHCSSIKR